MSDNVAVVLRRSHRKSTLGCQSCKRRHVKCDELRPTCQRCRKAALTCVYLVQDENQGSNSIFWPAVIKEACRKWQGTGVSPFAFLSLTGSLSWHTMSMTELRYLYQMGLVESMLRLSGTSNMCAPWGEIPMMFQLANSFDFVAHTLAAASALRLATLSKSQEAAQDAERYHNLAIRGIYSALQSLTKDNADAVLGAALGCSYTMSDYRTLMMVAEYGSKVTSQMHNWSKQSIFNRPVPNGEKYINGEHGGAGPLRDRDTADVAHIANLLMEGVEASNRLSLCFREELNYAAKIRCLRDALRYVHRRLDTAIPPAEQFQIVLPFTCWFTRDASSCYIAVTKKDPRIFSFLMHMYAVVLALTLSLPATDFSIFASLRVRAVLEICRALEETQRIRCIPCNQFHDCSEVTQFPLNAVRHYYRLGQGRLELMAQ